MAISINYSPKFQNLLERKDSNKILPPEQSSLVHVCARHGGHNVTLPMTILILCSIVSESYEATNICVIHLLWKQQHHRNDLKNPDVVDSELHVMSWKRKWSKQSVTDRPTSLVAAIISCDRTCFSNIFILLKVASTFGVTLCECEQSFSVMWRLRTGLRAKMGTPKMSFLALMTIHYWHAVD